MGGKGREMLETLKSLWKDESGGTAIEYGLIATLVSVAGIGVFDALGGSLVGILTVVSTDISSVVSG